MGYAIKYWDLLNVMLMVALRGQVVLIRAIYCWMRRDD